MARNQDAGCVCRAPLEELAAPVFATTAEQFEWLAAHGVVDIAGDHLGRLSVPMADALRLRREADDHADRMVLAAREARAAHVAAVAELREAVAAAFLDETGGEATVTGENLILTVAERKAAQVAAGLTAARAIWQAAPFQVATEVHQINVIEGDTTMSYDLAVVLPRATVDDGVARAVDRANRAAAV